MFHVASIYVDGACIHNGFHYAKAGIGVWWGDNNKNNISEPLYGRATNNRAEIYAAIRGINQAADLGYDRVIVHTDSQFLVNSITKWIKKWLNNGWKTIRRTTVKNKNDFIELLNAKKRIDVKFVKVAAHSGIYGNIKADRLAKRGIQKLFDDKNDKENYERKEYDENEEYDESEDYDESEETDCDEEYDESEDYDQSEETDCVGESDGNEDFDESKEYDESQERVDYDEIDESDENLNESEESDYGEEYDESQENEESDCDEEYDESQENEESDCSEEYDENKELDYNEEYNQRFDYNQLQLLRIRFLCYPSQALDQMLRHD